MDAGARLRKPRELMMTGRIKRKRETLSCEPGRRRREQRVEQRDTHKTVRQVRERGSWF